MDNVKEKIRKLLAKATSDNEHEAQAALLKARELMARYKVTEAEVSDAKKAELNHVSYEEQTFSGIVNTWFNELAHTIAENHCCGVCRRVCGQAVRKNSAGYVVFVGLEEDPEIARELFSYSVQHIQAQAREYKEYITARQLYPANQRKERSAAWENSYAQGFCKGLSDQYAAQFAQEKGKEAATMALALVQPQEVKDYMSGLKSAPFSRRVHNENESARAQGYNAGRNFNPVKQIAAQ